MKKILFLLLFTFLISCQQNKESNKIVTKDTASIKKTSIPKKRTEIKLSDIDFLSSEKKLWYRFEELPIATYSEDDKIYYQVYFFPKNKKDYMTIANTLENSSNNEVKQIVQNKDKFYKIAFLTKSKNIGKAIEYGQTNYYSEYPSFKYIYLYDDTTKKWKYVDTVLFESITDKKIYEIQKIICNITFERLSSKLTSRSLEDWTGKYYWDSDEGQNNAKESTQVSYSLGIHNDSIIYEGMAYMVNFKFSCLYENKGDTLDIYEYHNLHTNENDLDVFPLRIFKKNKRYFSNSLNNKEKEIYKAKQ